MREGTYPALPPMAAPDTNRIRKPRKLPQNVTKKHCSRCLRWLPTTRFSLDRTRSDGLCHWCRDCAMHWVRGYRAVQAKT
jgi:hypothetical protein